MTVQRTSKPALALAALALAGTASAIEVPFTVTGIRDGQTITVKLGGGQQSTLRLAGVRDGNQAVLARLLPVGTRGWAVVDGRKPHSPGQPAAAYVYLCGVAPCREAKTLLNKSLLLAGGGRLDPQGADPDHLPVLTVAEAAAKLSKRGIWAR